MARPYLWNDLDPLMGEGLFGTSARRRAMERNIGPQRVAQAASRSTFTRGGTAVSGQAIADAVTAADDSAAMAAAQQAADRVSADVARRNYRTNYENSLAAAARESGTIENQATANIGKAAVGSVANALLEIGAIDRKRKAGGLPGIGELLKQGFEGIKDRYPSPAKLREEREATLREEREAPPIEELSSWRPPHERATNRPGQESWERFPEQGPFERWAYGRRKPEWEMFPEQGAFNRFAAAHPLMGGRSLPQGVREAVYSPPEGAPPAQGFYFPEQLESGTEVVREQPGRYEGLEEWLFEQGVSEPQGGWSDESILPSRESYANFDRFPGNYRYGPELPYTPTRYPPPGRSIGQWERALEDQAYQDAFVSDIDPRTLE